MSRKTNLGMVLVLLAPGSFARAGAVDPPLAVPSEEDIAAAAPILGRVVEKQLGATATRLKAIQWARIPGRGIIYLAELEAFTPTSYLRAERPSEEELTWENARRSLRGQPPLVAGHESLTNTTVSGVKETLERFGDRVRLPEGETSRFVLYGREDTTSCVSCHADIADLTVTRRGGFVHGPPMINLGNFENGWRHPFDSTGLHRTQVTPESYLALDAARIWPVETSAQRTDAAVLAHVMGTALARAFPEEYWGVDIQGRPGAFGVTAGDWGPVIVLNMTFPIRRDAAADATRARDLWDEAVRDLQGRREGLPAGAAKQAENAAEKVIDTRELLTQLKTALADFGPRVRDLGPEQEIIVMVYGGGWSSSFGLAVGTDENARGVGWEAIPATRSPDYILRASAEDLERLRSGDIDRGQFMERIRVTSR